MMEKAGDNERVWPGEKVVDGKVKACECKHLGAHARR